MVAAAAPIRTLRAAAPPAAAPIQALRAAAPPAAAPIQTLRAAAPPAAAPAGLRTKHFLPLPGISLPSE
jgi:hypothetical protein